MPSESELQTRLTEIQSQLREISRAKRRALVRRYFHELYRIGKGRLNTNDMREVTMRVIHVTSIHEDHLTPYGSSFEIRRGVIDGQAFEVRFNERLFDFLDNDEPKPDFREISEDEFIHQWEHFLTELETEKQSPA